MEAKPTKGPWTVLDGAILCEHVNTYGNFHIASFGRGDEPNTPEDFANARLIAAAPDLKRVAHETQAFIASLGHTKAGTQGKYLYDLAEAAIASTETN